MVAFFFAIGSEYSTHQMLSGEPRLRLECAAMTSPSVLAIDTASKIASVAAKRGDREAIRCLEQRQMSAVIVGLIDEVLAEIGAPLGEVDHLFVIRGPGSFTGLRVGLATAFGLSTGSALPLYSMTTFQALACAAARSGVAGPVPKGPVPKGPVLTAVDALHGAWCVQPFDPKTEQPLDEYRRCASAEVDPRDCTSVIGHGAEGLGELLGLPSEPLSEGLAGVMASRPRLSDWPSDVLLLHQETAPSPLYLAPPPIHRKQMTTSARLRK